MKKLLLLIMSAILVFGMIGCNRSGAKESVKVSIRGEITKVAVGNDKEIKSILVEGKLEKDTEYDKASVFIDNKTAIYTSDENVKMPVSELKEGLKVEVIITGPVRESYPVQATANTIRIIQ